MSRRTTGDQDLNGALEAFRAAAHAEADVHFDDRALEVQRHRILDRLASGNGIKEDWIRCSGQIRIAEDFPPVEVNHGSVIPFQGCVDRRGTSQRNCGNLECLPEISRDGPGVLIGAGADHCGFVAVAVAQLRRT